MRWALQMPSASFNAAQLAVIGTDGQLPKLDLAFLLRFYAESHVGIPAVLQVLFQASAPRTWSLTTRPPATLPYMEASLYLLISPPCGALLSSLANSIVRVQRSCRRC